MRIGRQGLSDGEVSGRDKGEGYEMRSGGGEGCGGAEVDKRWTRDAEMEIVRGEVERKGLASATQRERCATRTLRPICERQGQEQG